MAESALDKLVAEMEAQYADYWAELGRFLHRFAHTEQILQHALYHFLGLSLKLGSAAFGDTRAIATRDAVSRILDAKGHQKIKANLERPFAQLGLINTMRNRLVHWSAHFDINDDLIVTNAHQEPVPEKLKILNITVDDIKQMSQDLARINLYLMLEIHPLHFDQSVRQQLSQPWQYKQPRQTPPKSKPRELPLKRIRLRDAFRESP